MAISFIGVAYLSYTLSKRLKQIERLSERQVNEVNALNAINNKIVQIIDQGVVVLSHDLEILSPMIPQSTNYICQRRLIILICQIFPPISRKTCTHHPRA